MDILLVEDNPGDVLMIKTTLDELKTAEYNLIVKTNGLAASNYIEQTEKGPDLIILDLNLPHKNGFEVFSVIIESEVFKKVPVVVFTSSANQMDTQKALSMGAKAYIVKPIDYEEYRSRVISFLQYAHR